MDVDVAIIQQVGQCFDILMEMSTFNKIKVLNQRHTELDDIIHKRFHNMCNTFFLYPTVEDNNFSQQLAQIIFSLLSAQLLLSYRLS